MGAWGGEAATRSELNCDGGLLRVSRVMPRVLLAELEGAVGLPHIEALTRFVEEWPATREGKVNLFQDLTAVASYAMVAQLHFSEWARARVEYIHKLHFAISPGSSLIPTLRSVVMAVPIRAYMYTDRKGLERAMQSFLRHSLANDL